MISSDKPQFVFDANTATSRHFAFDGKEGIIAGNYKGLLMVRSESSSHWKIKVKKSVRVSRSVFMIESAGSDEMCFHDVISRFDRIVALWPPSLTFHSVFCIVLFHLSIETMTHHVFIGCGVV